MLRLYSDTTEFRRSRTDTPGVESRFTLTASRKSRVISKADGFTFSAVRLAKPWMGERNEIPQRVPYLISYISDPLQKNKLWKACWFSKTTYAKQWSSRSRRGNVLVNQICGSWPSSTSNWRSTCKHPDHCSGSLHQCPKPQCRTVNGIGIFYIYNLTSYFGEFLKWDTSCFNTKMVSFRMIWGYPQFKKALYETVFFRMLLDWSFGHVLEAVSKGKN